MKIVKQPFPESEYYPHNVEKKAIVIHHTVSGPGINGDLATWKQPGRIATHYIIERDGTINQLYDDLHWGHHLGIESKVFKEHGIKYRFDPPPGRENFPYSGKGYPSNNHWIDAQTIGIELDSWGPLFKQADGSFHSVYKKKVHLGCEVQEYPDKFRGSQFYEKYTTDQLNGLRELLIHLTFKHNIPNGYIEEMWKVDKAALEVGAGIWSHTSYRSDKSDAHPQPELINTICSLTLSGIT